MKTARDKLKELGVFSGDIDNAEEIFRESDTMEKLSAQMIERSYPLDGPQYLAFHFKRLLKEHPELVGREIEALKPLGVHPDVIREYLEAGAGTDEAVVVRFKYVDVVVNPPPPEEKRMSAETFLAFQPAVEEVALREIRAYLGFE